MKKSEAVFGLLRIPLDLLAVLAALLLSYRLREANIDLIPSVQLLEPAQTLPAFDVYVRTFVVPTLVVYVIIAAGFGLYALRVTRSAWHETAKVIGTVLLWLVFVIAWYFLVRKQLFYSRILLLQTTVFMILFVALARAAVVILQRSFLRMGIGIYLVASIGEQHVSPLARESLKREQHYEYLGHLPDLSALKKLIQRCRPDLVLQTDPNMKSDQTVGLIEYCRSHHIDYGYLPPVFADVPHQLRVERLGMLPLVRFQPTPLDGWERIYKRIFDTIASTVLIVIFSPLMALIALAILITSGRPIFYISRRVAEKANGTIPVLKFRSMVKDAEARKQALLGENERRDGPLFKMRNDPRITPLGRLLRRFDLDELPQLFNVIIGQMSLVGPRPHLQEEVERYRPYERRVFTVKPGITGLSQVSGRSDLSFKEEVRYDLQYIEEWSMLFDLWILWRTIGAIIFKVRE